MAGITLPPTPGPNPYDNRWKTQSTELPLPPPVPVRTAAASAMSMRGGYGQGQDAAAYGGSSPVIQFSPSQNKLNVQGRVFDADDADSLLQSEQFLSEPPAGQQTGDWVDLSPDKYGRLLQAVRNPSGWELYKKNVGIGADTSQLLGARVLQFLGAEELGGRIAENQIDQIRKASPYTRELDDGFGQYALSVLGQATPSIIESFLAAVVGGGIAYATGRQALLKGIETGAVTGLTKQVLQKGLAGVAQRVAQGAATAEEKALISRIATGATAGAFAQGYGTGLGDVVNEQVEAGMSVSDTRTPGTLGYAGLYALGDVIPERLVAGTLAKAAFRAAAPPKAGLLANVGRVAGRTGKGMGLAATAEGIGEASQEATLIGANPNLTLQDPTAQGRILEAGMAGALVGGVLGGAGGALARGTKPVDIIQPGRPAEPPTAGDQGVPQLPAPQGPAGLLTYQPQVPTEGGPTSIISQYQLPAPEGPAGLLPLLPPDADATREQFYGNVRGLEDQRSAQQAQWQQESAELDAMIADAQQSADRFTRPNPLLERTRAVRERLAERQQWARESTEIDDMISEAERAAGTYAAQSQLLQQQQATPIEVPPVTADMNQYALRQRTSPQAAALVQGMAPDTADALNITAQENLPPATPADKTKAASKWNKLRKQVFGGQDNPLYSWGNTRPEIRDGFISEMLAGRSDEDLAAYIKEALTPRMPAAKAQPATTPPKGASFLQKGAQTNAVQERKAAEVPVGQRAGSGKKVVRRGEAQETKAQEEVAAKPTARENRIKEMVAKGEQKLAAKEWPDFGPDDTKFADLDEQGKQEWTELYKSTNMTVDAAQRIYDESEARKKPTPAGRETPSETKPEQAASQAEVAPEENSEKAKVVALLTQADEHLKSPRSPEYAEAIAKVAQYFVNGTDMDALMEIDGWLRNFPFKKSGVHITRTRDALIAAVHDKNRRSAEAVFAEGKPEISGLVKPWFQLALDKNYATSYDVQFNNLDDTLAKQLVLDDKINIGQLPKDQQERIAPAPTPKATKKEPHQLLATLLDKGFSGLRKSQVADFKAEAAKLWKQVADDQRGFVTSRGLPLSEYFTEDGEVKVNNSRGKYFVSHIQVEGEAKVSEVELRAAREAYDAKKKEGEQRGDWFRTDGTPITKPLSTGKVKLLVSNMLRKLTKKPKVHVYESQADLKARNPQLYRRAAAQRSDGDFDSTDAAGYSFRDGDEEVVILFSNNLATEQAANFVLAHEVLGHFGFRAIMPAQAFNNVMMRIYELDGQAREYADKYSAAFGVSKAEAVEEYLADYAGKLETSLLARFWNSIKNFLSKLGVTLNDDIARYVVSVSRQYVRNGTVPARFVQFSQIAQDMAHVETLGAIEGTGRFSANKLSGYLPNDMAIIDSDARDHMTYDYKEVSEWLRKAKDSGINIKDSARQFLNQLRTMNNLARENRGYRALFLTLRNTVRRATELRNKYNTMMKRALRPSFFGFGGDITEDQLGTVNAWLLATAEYKYRTLDEKKLKDIKGVDLVKYVNGVPRIQKAPVQELQAMGTFTLEDLKKDITYEVTVEKPITAEERARREKVRDAVIAAAEQRNASEKELAAIKLEQDAFVNSNVMDSVEVKVIKGKPDLTKDSPEWKAYEEVRKTMDEAAKDKLLAEFMVFDNQRRNVERVAGNMLGKTLTTANKDFLEAVENQYIKLYWSKTETNTRGAIVPTRGALEDARNFAAGINAMLLSTESDTYLAGDAKKLAESLWEDVSAEYVADGIKGLKQGATIRHDKGSTESQGFRLQQAIENLALHDLKKTQAIEDFKRSVATGYVPWGREGRHQVRVVAKELVMKDGKAESTGRIYGITERFRDQLVFMQMDRKSDADTAAEAANKLMEDINNAGGFEMEVLVGDKVEIRKVILEAKSEFAPLNVAATTEASIGQFLSVVSRFSINITPAERERLIVGMTNQESRMRTRLRRAFVKGVDPNALKYISQHLEANASKVSRMQYRYEIDKLFDEEDGNSRRLWAGDGTEYKALKEEWEAVRDDPNASEEQKHIARKKFAEYHYTYVTKDSEHTANDYRAHGERLMAFLDAQKDVEFTDFGSGELANKLRMWTSIAYLGMSISGGVLNVASISTNVAPALAGFNPKNGFGGGFGWGNASTALTKALGDTKSKQQEKPEYWNSLVNEDENTGEITLTDAGRASGMTYEEILFMRHGVQSGMFQPALVNALQGTGRGKMTKGGRQAAYEAWMTPFTYTEQYSRRTAGLAAFRLEFDRQYQALRPKMSEEKARAEAARIAANFAEELVEDTLGEYAMFNRPSLFRGGIAQFLFVYKMFVVNTLQMLAMLPRKEQLLFLGIMMLLSGMKGLPFADDFMDLLDTIAQALGLGAGKVWRGTAEKTLVDFLDEHAPGLTPFVMRGVLNNVTSANTSDRFGMGNVIPGTALGVAGSDVGRELVEIMGPVASFAAAAFTTVSDIGRWGLEAVGVRDDVTSINSILRNAPFIAVRALADTYTIYDTGAMLNSRGQVVSEDVTPLLYLTRAVGFYPSEATRNNDVIRISTRLTDWKNEIATKYKSAYIAARISGDTKWANDVIRQAEAFSEQQRRAKTGLELSNIRRSFDRAYREAVKPATERYIGIAPRAFRPEAQRISEALGAGEME